MKKGSSALTRTVCFRPSGLSAFDWTRTVRFDSRPSTFDVISTCIVQVLFKPYKVSLRITFLISIWIFNFNCSFPTSLILSKLNQNFPTSSFFFQFQLYLRTSARTFELQPNFPTFQLNSFELQPKLSNFRPNFSTSFFPISSWTFQLLLFSNCYFQLLFLTTGTRILNNLVKKKENKNY